MAGRSRPAIPRDVKRTGAMPDTASRPPLPPLPQSFDDPLGRKIIELHIWSVGEGLRGTEAALLFDGLCQRLVIAGVPLWRAFAGMRTLHPQWGGYAYTWWRDRGVEQPIQFARGNQYEQELEASPFGHLRRQAKEQSDVRGPLLHLRRQLVGSEAQLDFPPLKDLAAAGATDYFAVLVLSFEGAVADFAETMKEDGARQAVARLALWRWEGRVTWQRDRLFL